MLSYKNNPIRNYNKALWSAKLESQVGTYIEKVKSENNKININIYTYKQ